jgi:hypothetical protein
VDQGKLDRYIFDQMRRDARERWHLRGIVYRPPHFHDRRRAYRIEVQEGDLKEDRRRLSRVDQARLIAERFSAWPAVGAFVVSDLSSTGCAIQVSSKPDIAAGTRVGLQLLGNGLDLAVHGRVIYVRRGRRPSDNR